MLQSISVHLLIIAVQNRGLAVQPPFLAALASMAPYEPYYSLHASGAPWLPGPLADLARSLALRLVDAAPTTLLLAAVYTIFLAASWASALPVAAVATVAFSLLAVLELRRSWRPRPPTDAWFLVTGTGTAGLGRATVLRLLTSGARVVAGVLTEGEAAAWRTRGPWAAAGTLVPVVLDVTDAASVSAAKALVLEQCGPSGLAGVVNVAGMATSGPLEVTDVQTMRKVMDVNVWGGIAIAQAFAPLLRTSRGRLVNLTSVAGRVVSPYLGAYSMSKHAMEAATDALRQELHPWGIHVAAVEPGFIATPMVADLDSLHERMVGGLSAEARALYGTELARLPAINRAIIGSAGKPEWVAAAVAHALQSRWPRTRYLVGADARLFVAVRWLIGDRQMDSHTRRRMLHLSRRT